MGSGRLGLHQCERRLECSESRRCAASVLRRHCQSNGCPFASVQRGHQLGMRYLGRKTLTVHRIIVADDEHLRTRITRHLDSAPLSGIQIALRSRSCTQRARLETIELRLWLPPKNSKSHRDRLGSMMRHSLQASESTLSKKRPYNAQASVARQRAVGED